MHRTRPREITDQRALSTRESGDYAEFFARRICTADKPMDRRTLSVSAPGADAVPANRGTVREKRGAGAGCFLPSTSTQLPRARLCRCSDASFMLKATG